MKTQTIMGTFNPILQQFTTTGKELKKIKHKFGVKWGKEWHTIPKRNDNNNKEFYRSLIKSNAFSFAGILIPVKYFMEICRTYDKNEIITLSLDISRRYLILESENGKTIIKQQLQAEINDEIIVDLINS